jgi:hypothetical protein
MPWLADRFEEHRPRLRAVACRMLGSLTEADDAVQNTWTHVSRADAGEAENIGGLADHDRGSCVFELAVHVLVPASLCHRPGLRCYACR